MRQRQAPYLVVASHSWGWNDLAMLGHLVLAGTTAVVAGFAHPLRAYPSIATYGIGVCFVGLSLAVFVTSPAATRRLLLGMALIVAGGYAIIAVGRASLLGTSPRFQAYGAAVARYHYVGPIGIAIVLCLLLARIEEWVRPGARCAHLLLVAWIALTLVQLVGSEWTIDHFDQDRRTVEAEVRMIDAAMTVYANRPTVHLPNDQAVFTRFGGPGFVGRAAIYAIFFPPRSDQDVFFLEPDAAIRELAPPESRLGGILVAAPVGARRRRGARAHPRS